MRLLRVIIWLPLFFIGTVQALINGVEVPSSDWRSVVLLELIDPDTSLHTSCTATIISEFYAVTTASCILHEETGKMAAKVKVCIGHKKPFNGENQRCFNAKQIIRHHKYLKNSGLPATYNLAYIKFDKALNLQKMGLNPAQIITPNEFSTLVSNHQLPDIRWVGFDAGSQRKKVKGIKQQGTVKGAEFDYQTRTIKVDSTSVRPGNHYQGIASFIKMESGVWKFIGMVSQSTPDQTVLYYPEFNPCDEDPITVAYPKPIMQVTTTMTAFPVAGCEMIDFEQTEGFDEFACKKLLFKSLSWKKALSNGNPVALRQKALQIYKENNSTNEAGEIYKLLFQAKQSGDEKAAIVLAKFLLQGNLFDEDRETAESLLVQPAKNNNPTAILLQAKMLLFPEGQSEIAPSTSETDQQIFALIKKSATAGLSEAQYLLARLYQLGIGTTKNHKKAYQWYAQSAMQGNADGQFQLGMQWNDGRAVRRYPELALFWIQQAAAQGQLDAQNQLGLLKP
ncbi:MAG: hypothetical protein DRQ47_01155 [Gammaproteobacteria bacterium]|nr:MAG: hypothetical protein DRQ47_01155 [Gammaproteobacteria bacterium]